MSFISWSIETARNIPISKNVWFKISIRVIYREVIPVSKISLKVAYLQNSSFLRKCIFSKDRRKLIWIVLTR